METSLKTSTRSATSPGPVMQDGGLPVEGSRGPWAATGGGVGEDASADGERVTRNGGPPRFLWRVPPRTSFIGTKGIPPVSERLQTPCKQPSFSGARCGFLLSTVWAWFPFLRDDVPPGQHLQLHLDSALESHSGGCRFETGLLL